MALPRHDRIIPLRLLRHYPGAQRRDMTFFLPRVEKAVRRVWAAVPESTPVFRVNDTEARPRRVTGGPPRWIDYGVCELPTGFSQLRVSGIAEEECCEAFLLITSVLDFTPEGLTVEDTERRLWGLARSDAGRTMVHPSWVPAGEPTRFHVVYAAGANGLPAGAVVRFAVPKAFSFPQTRDAAAGGFVTVTRSDRRVSIVAIEPSVESHELTDIFCRLDDGLAPFGSFELQYRSDRTYIYSSTFCQTDRMYWYSKLPPLSAAAAISENRPFVSPAEGNGHRFDFVPGPTERLHLFLPGRRRASEKLTLRGTFTDRCRNSPPSGSIHAELDLQLVRDGREMPLGSPAERFTARHRFEMPLPPLSAGIYRAVARPRGSDRVLALSNPMEVMRDGEERAPVYWGEIHGHSEMSDGCGDYAERYRHARDEGCLDFAAAADHACYFSDNEWLWMQDVTNAWNEPGRFVTLNGYEWAGRQAHRNIYTSRDRLPLFRGMYPPTSHLSAVYPQFHGDEDVVAGPHAPLAHGLIWQFHDPSVERFVEIYSMWGASDSRENPLVPEFARRNPTGMTADEILKTGARLGFTGGGDCHEGRVGFSAEDASGQGVTPHTFAAVLLYRCGMTAALMPTLDRLPLVQAIRNRRTYATTGARILLEFSVSGVPMGGVGQAQVATCSAVVHAVEPLRDIEIVKDGEVVSTHPGSGRDMTFSWCDPDPPTREHSYYLRVVQQDGEMAWSSPVWIGPRTDG